MTKMYSLNEIFESVWLYKTLDLKTMETVEKEVRVTNVLDGPGADRRDYCTVEGIHDWEVDMPLENFLNNARIAA